MSAKTVQELLTQSLRDVRFSRGERATLQALLEEAGTTPHEREHLLHYSFELARERIADYRDVALLDWLEEVVKGLKVAREEKDAIEPRRAQAWFLPDSQVQEHLISLLNGCRRRLDLCIFTITNNQLSNAVLAAQQRGVEIRLITDDDKMMDLGSDVERLRRSGIRVSHDGSSAHMHHKFALLDGRTLVTGSFNWTRSAVDENYENILVIDEPVLIKTYQKEFDRLWHLFQVGRG